MTEMFGFREGSQLELTGRGNPSVAPLEPAPPGPARTPWCPCLLGKVLDQLGLRLLLGQTF